VVSGWSAQWDDALCAAFDRCKSRRFGTYWAHRGDTNDRAQRLIAARGAQSIEAADAEKFFPKLADTVFSLEDLNRPHPVSVASAVALAKRLLVDEKHRIQLHDLIDDETEKSRAALAETLKELTGTATAEKISRYLDRMLADTE